jgi:hypothetical protein
VEFRQQFERHLGFLRRRFSFKEAAVADELAVAGSFEDEQSDAGPLRRDELRSDVLTQIRDGGSSIRTHHAK